ncbi:MAG: M20/M25/M40 family metallo-hydrolase [Candidatus Thorarchaeota archaeon]|nr:M20/M25/M40 family metallo-hydrolase [Candidatus Thorarchaeota archaeon]
MIDNIFALLKELSDSPGPVGREEAVQDLVAAHLQELGIAIRRDGIGNLIATLNGTDSHFALVAHADEVGFLVSYIEEQGFLRVKWNTQGHLPDLRLLPGQRVLLLTEKGTVPGCFCVKTAHIAGARGKARIPTQEEVFLDIGATSTEEVSQMGVHVGTPVIYDTQLQMIGRNVVGKSLDDRVGLAILIAVAKEMAIRSSIDRPTITFVSTVMEEMGAKGAAAVAKELEVNGVIILEIGLADDHPGTSAEAGISLGKGPVIVVKDTQLHYSHKQNQELVSVAEKNEIPFQRAVYHNYMTDGVQMVAQGHTVSAVGVPCRYSHSSFETVMLEDVVNTIKLLLDFLTVSK